MTHPEPLRGPDITHHLKNPTSCGVGGAAAPDGVQTVELTSEPTVHGPHGFVHVRFALSEEPAVTAEVSWGSRGRAMCRSADSIRIWGAFAPEADLLIRAQGGVRLIARSGTGAILAGPIIVSSAIESLSLAW
jgi:hypothetical protein